jgi:hypothetical protein
LPPADARHPFVYATRDRSGWFVVAVDRWEAVNARGVSADEAAALAARIGADLG